MSKYEYLSEKKTVPDSGRIIEKLSDYPVTSVHSDNTLGRVVVKTDEPLDEEDKEEVDEIVRETIKEHNDGGKGAS